MRIQRVSSLVSVITLLFGATASAQLVPAPGWSATRSTLGGGATFVGGLCRLPGGKLALFDGSKVVEFDPALGAAVATLYTPPTFVFGSFLAAAPNGQSIYFGESSQGSITRIPLGGGATSLLKVLPFAYDAAFDAFDATGALFVSRGTPSFTASEIVRIDVATGAVDVIATMPGPSGPLAFDSAGTLYYGENSPLFPAPIGSGTLWSFDATAVASAIGPTVLTTNDGVAIAPMLDALSDIVIDAEGDLVVSDSIHGRVYELAATGTLRAEIAKVPGGGATYLAFVDDSANAPARFDPFQPATGGILAVVASDYQTFTELTIERPRRAVLTIQPANPIAIGPLTLGLADGPPNALLLLFASAGSGPEAPAFLEGMPYFFGLSVPLVVLASLPLDGAGAIALPAANPGIGATIHLQGALYGPPAGAIGTTEILSLVLQ